MKNSKEKVFKRLTETNFKKLSEEKQLAYLDELDELSSKNKAASKEFDYLYSKYFLY